jgi:hypothetical protein
MPQLHAGVAVFKQVETTLVGCHEDFWFFNKIFGFSARFLVLIRIFGFSARF